MGYLFAEQADKTSDWRVRGKAVESDCIVLYCIVLYSRFDKLISSNSKLSKPRVKVKVAETSCQF